MAASKSRAAVFPTPGLVPLDSVWHLLPANVMGPQPALLGQASASMAAGSPIQPSQPRAQRTPGGRDPQGDPNARGQGWERWNIHTLTWKTDPSLPGLGESDVPEPGLMEKTAFPSRAPSSTWEQGPGARHPRQSPTPPTGQEPKACEVALPPAWFSPQYKEGGRLSFFPGQEQGGIRFPCLPHPRSPCCTRCGSPAH